jgi:hypothetical protein
MKNELIQANDIYMQDIVCSIVSQRPADDDFALYNTIATIIDIPTLETTEKVLRLIRMNKLAFIN